MSLCGDLTTFTKEHHNVDHMGICLSSCKVQPAAFILSAPRSWTSSSKCLFTFILRQLTAFRCHRTGQDVNRVDGGLIQPRRCWGRQTDWLHDGQRGDGKKNGDYCTQTRKRKIEKLLLTWTKPLWSHPWFPVIVESCNSSDRPGQL